MMANVWVFGYGIALLMAIANSIFVLWKVVSTSRRRRRRMRILFLPKASAGTIELEGYPKNSGAQWEYLRLFQTGPVPYPIESYRVRGHCELIRLVRNGRQVEMDLIGDGYVRVLWNVSESFLKSLLKNGSIDENFDVKVAQSEWRPFSSESVMIDRRSSVDDTGSSGMIIVLISQDDLKISTEITGGYFPQTGDSTAPEVSPNVFQLSISSSNSVHGEDRIVLVQGVFTGGMGSGECMICYENACNTILVPCRHCSICSACLGQLREPKCVCCRDSFTTYLYLPTI
jgi:hypothetical protein